MTSLKANKPFIGNLQVTQAALYFWHQQLIGHDHGDDNAIFIMLLYFVRTHKRIEWGTFL